MSLAQRLAGAIRRHQPLPGFDSDLDLDQAYRVQSEVAALVSPGGFAGIKAGVTSPALQQNFGIDHALLGRLYESGRLENGAHLPCIDGQLLECEIGIIVDGNCQPKAAALTLEFAFLKFATPTDATAANLVAANVATDAFMTAAPQPWSDYTGTRVQLYRDDELINDADIMESLGGPGPALLWIRGEAYRHDIAIDDGALIMTGACGKVVPALPGNYRAECGPLGELSFSIG